MYKKLTTIVLIMLFATVELWAVTAATVNGIEISVAEANKALEVISQGKQRWKELSREEKKQLIQMIAPSKLVFEASQKELSQREKDAALSGVWMQKSIANIAVSDERAKAAYEKMKKASKAEKNKEKIPAFEQVKQSIKMQLAQEELLTKLMKKAEIKLK